MSDKLLRFGMSSAEQFRSEIEMEDAPLGSVGFLVSPHLNSIAISQKGAGYIFFRSPEMMRLIAESLNEMADEWETGKLELTPPEKP